MAIQKLGKAGYGQVEPNHVGAQRTGAVYAQLPVASASLTSLNGVVENGLFLDYDYASGTAKLPSALGGSSLTMLVMNEVRLYADFLTAKDFAQVASGTAVNIGLAPEKGGVYPRVYKMNVGDLFTTNLVAAETGADATAVISDFAVGDILVPSTGGVLTKVSSVTTEALQVKVVAITTTPDLQPAVKVQVVKAG